MKANWREFYMVTREQIVYLRERITDEIFAAFGMKKYGTMRKLFGWLFFLPTSRFARMFSEADEAVSRGGLGAGCKVLMDYLSVHVNASGVENIPSDGPLMILSNHPGAYDSVAIGSNITRRDFRVIAGEIPFYYALPNISPLLIYAPVASDTAGRMVTLRNAIAHLQAGGSLLHFGAGTIEPDPSVQAGAIEWMSRWSPSVEIMLRKAPETTVVPTIASGVLLKRFFKHPVTLIRKQPVAKRRVAEFMQVLQQLVFPRSIKADMHLRFAQAIPVSELMSEAGNGRLMPVLIKRFQDLVTDYAVADNLLL
jgi:hypothetical protein